MLKRAFNYTHEYEDAGPMAEKASGNRTNNETATIARHYGSNRCLTKHHMIARI